MFFEEQVNQPLVVRDNKVDDAFEGGSPQKKDDKSEVSPRSAKTVKNEKPNVPKLDLTKQNSEQLLDVTIESIDSDEDNEEDWDDEVAQKYKQCFLGSANIDFVAQMD